MREGRMASTASCREVSEEPRRGTVNGVAKGLDHGGCPRCFAVEAVCGLAYRVQARPLSVSKVRPR